MTFPIDSLLARSLSPVIFEILRSKHIGVTNLASQGDVTSFILVPIDFSYTTSYRLSIVTYRLATIHNVTNNRRPQTDASLSHKRDRTKRLPKAHNINALYMLCFLLQLAILASHAVTWTQLNQRCVYSGQMTRHRVSVESRRPLSSRNCIRRLSRRIG